LKKLVLLLLFLLPSFVFGMVRIQDIVQGGQGEQGIVSINLKDDYDISKAKVKFLKDSVLINLPDTFILPIKRVFRPSSPRSSVVKIDAQIKSSESVDVIIYFRSKYFNAIKKTYKLEKEKNNILFKYSIVAPVNEVKAKKEEINNKEIKKEEIKENSKKESLKSLEKLNKEKVKEDASLDLKQFKTRKNPNSFSTWRIIKLVFIFLGIFGLIFISVILSKKYFSSPSYSIFNNKKELKEIRDNNLIKIVERKKLSYFKTLYVIEVLNEKFLISETRTKIKLISKLKEINISSSSYEDKDNLLMKNRIKNTLKDI
jgi:flagellar biogenesis protein FliO